MNYKEFAQKIKAKYPDYNDMDDQDLAQKMVAKFPEYSDVTFEEFTSQPDSNLIVTDETKKPISDPNYFGLPDNVEKAVFPKFGVQAKGERQEGMAGVRQAIGAATEGLSLPLRSIGAIGTGLQAKMAGKDNQTAINEALTDLGKTKSDAKGVGGFVENVIEDPAMIPSLMVGGPLINAGKSALAKAGSTALVGALEGGVSAGVHQAQNYAETGKVNLGEAAVEVGVSTLFPLAVAGASALKKTVTTKVDNIAGRIAEWATGVDEEALRMAGTKQGEQALKLAFGKQAEIGAELVDVIDDAYNYMPDYKVIDNALKQTPAVDVVPMIKKLEDAAGKPTTAEMKAVSEKILAKAEEVRNLAVNSGSSGYVNATDLIAYRKELDDIIGDSWGKESGKYVNILKNIRHDIKEEVLKNAKGTEYEKTMQEFAEKLDALDKIKTLVGKTSDARELRAESFIRNINNNGKTKAREWLTDFEKVFGGDFVEKSKLTRFAEMMGDEGSGSLLPRWTTGRSLWSKGAGIAVGSPKLASKVTLPLTEKATRSTGAEKVINNKLTRQAVRTGTQTENEESASEYVNSHNIESSGLSTEFRKWFNSLPKGSDRAKAYKEFQSAFKNKRRGKE